MTRRVRVFARTDLGTECEVCGARFDLIGGGACVHCRRVLCARHLYGSWLRRLMVDFGAAPVCCACRHAA
ncbi:MAG TPA: hypothetical protein VL524_10555 [Gemmatimonadaceae bacterium]|jgi:hypothetical protein|nr:hypothetical protein [Gemmatimonadaceae bacterium]